MVVHWQRHPLDETRNFMKKKKNFHAVFFRKTPEFCLNYNPHVILVSKLSQWKVPPISGLCLKPQQTSLHLYKHSHL